MRSTGTPVGLTQTPGWFDRDRLADASQGSEEHLARWSRPADHHEHEEQQEDGPPRRPESSERRLTRGTGEGLPVPDNRPVVVLPEPFGLSRPKISPPATSNETSSTATVAP